MDFFNELEFFENLSIVHYFVKVDSLEKELELIQLLSKNSEVFEIEKVENGILFDSNFILDNLIDELLSKDFEVFVYEPDMDVETEYWINCKTKELVEITEEKLFPC